MHVSNFDIELCAPVGMTVILTLSCVLLWV